MSLSQKAATAAAAERTVAQQQAKEGRRQTREKMVARLRQTWDGKPSDLADYEIKWIDNKTIEYPKRHSSQYGGETFVVTSVYVYRFRVDDVILWATSEYREGIKFTPEVTCVDCGREIGASFCEGVYGAEASYGNDVVRALQYLAGREFHCPWCTTQLPRICPTCGRGNV